VRNRPNGPAGEPSELTRDAILDRQNRRDPFGMGRIGQAVRDAVTTGFSMDVNDFSRSAKSVAYPGEHI